MQEGWRNVRWVNQGQRMQMMIEESAVTDNGKIHTMQIKWR